MTYYLSQPQNQPYRTVMAVPYLAVPQYRQSVSQRYLQQPSPLTKMITQNYLALSKLGNPRLQTRVNLNHPQELKYYVPAQIPSSQYQKSPTIIQYVRPQIHEQVLKQQDADYDQQQQEPQGNIQYAKPSADEVIQFAKPEVQQYVTKYNDPFLQYTKQHDSDYEQDPQTPIPQYVTKPVEPLKYTIKTEDANIPYRMRKPIIQYVPKVDQGPNAHLADEPDYSDKPLSAYRIQPGKGDQTTVTITQSQEIDVDPLPSSPAPIPKYHATYVANPQRYTSYQSYYEDKEEVAEPEVVDRNLNDILRGGVSLSKSLPDKITSENLDSSIKTLSKILRILQAAHSLPHSAKTIIKNFPNPSEVKLKEPSIKLVNSYAHKNDGGSTPGRAGIDYPVYDEIPQTQFSCKEQRYKGFFGDPETRCQVNNVNYLFLLFASNSSILKITTA